MGLGSLLLSAFGISLILTVIHIRFGITDIPPG